MLQREYGLPLVTVGRAEENIRFVEGVPVNFKNAHGRPCLVILDDLLRTFIRSKFATSLLKAAIIEISASY